MVDEDLDGLVLEDVSFVRFCQGSDELLSLVSLIENTRDIEVLESHGCERAHTAASEEFVLNALLAGPCICDANSINVVAVLLWCVRLELRELGQLDGTRHERPLRFIGECGGFLETTVQIITHPRNFFFYCKRDHVDECCSS